VRAAEVTGFPSNTGPSPPSSGAIGDETCTGVETPTSVEGSCVDESELCAGKGVDGDCALADEDSSGKAAG
jgi:hypothetical protein